MDNNLRTGQLIGRETTKLEAYADPKANHVRTLVSAETTNVYAPVGPDKKVYIGEAMSGPTKVSTYWTW
jgi:hypothetical protein